MNVDRNRDFLPSHDEDVPTSGGADKFLEFISSELMPFMDENYPVKGEDILLGHSFGGVFTMFALLEEPELFDAYLAGDPSFWWDDGYMVDLAAEKLPSLKNKGAILFIPLRVFSKRRRKVSKFTLCNSRIEQSFAHSPGTIVLH